MAACAVREIKSIRCFSPTKTNREGFAEQMRNLLGVEVEPVSQPEEATKGADIVMCASNSLDNIFFEPWVEPGVHLSSIKQPEIEIAALQRADRVVLHSTRDQPCPCYHARSGVGQEGQRARLVSRQCTRFRKLPTLPELIVGRAEGRRSDNEITCFMNNIGLGYQFARRRCSTAGTPKEAASGAIADRIGSPKTCTHNSAR